MEGAVELYIDLSCIDGKEKKTLLETINSEYSILGHKEFFSETVYNVNCKAINSARCIRVKREDFRSVAEKYGWVYYSVWFSNNIVKYEIYCNKQGKMMKSC